MSSPVQTGKQVISDLSEFRFTPRGSSQAVRLADHLSGFVNVRSYGAACDGVTDDYADLAAMVTALGSTSATLIVPGPCLVGTNLVIPSSLRVRFDGGGYFAGSGAVTFRRWAKDNAPTQYRAKRTIVTFIDDDGDAAVLTRLKPLFDAKGVPCVVAIPSDYVGTPGHLTDAQLVSLQGSGWEIASHSKSHFYADGSATESEIRAEMSLSKAALEGMGLSVNHYVYPGGHYTEPAARIARDYYGSASILGEYPNTGALRTWHLGRRHHGTGFTLAAQQAFVDAAIAAKSWIIFVTHSNLATLSAEDLTSLGLLIDYIKAANVPILTVNDAHAEIGNLTDHGYYPWAPEAASRFAIVDSAGDLTASAGYQAITGQTGDVRVTAGTSLVSVAANGSGSMSLIMPQQAETEGSVVHLVLTDRTRGLSIKNSALGTAVALTEFDRTGEWRLAYYGGAWTATRVSAEPLGYQVISGTQGEVQVQSRVSHLSVATTGSSFLVLRMPVSKQADGVSVDLNVTAYAQQVAVRDAAGTTQIAVGQIASVGYYRLTYYASAWHWVKLSDTAML
jgi:peptidoglycan/xylan/chitin deacetylase (PgdA/CDA1 family)